MTLLLPLYTDVTVLEKILPLASLAVGMVMRQDTLAGMEQAMVSVRVPDLNTRESISGAVVPVLNV